MPEPLYPPNATPEQRRRIDRQMLRMLEPPKGKPRDDEASKQGKPSSGGIKPKARKS
jgi:hypothetical protein